MDAIIDLIDVAFSKDLATQGTDIRTEFEMVKKLVPVIVILRIFSETFRHVFDGFVAEDAGRMIALVNVSRSTPKSKRWVIGNVATHPEHRRNGLARKLVTRSIEHARGLDADICTLEVRSENVPAYELYRGLGFVHFDSISELKLETLPHVKPNGFGNGYSVRPMKMMETDARYDIARREVPSEVQAFLPVNKTDFEIPPIARLFDPIARMVQKEDDHRWAVEHDGQLAGYMFLSARKIQKVAHRLAIRLLPEHSANLFEPMLTLALSKLEKYPRNNVLMSVCSSYEDQLDVLKRYGFVVYEETHRLGLKFKE
jgi:GNAT superfamily N-acetyltransferase